jgi:hypothetical protein
MSEDFGDDFSIFDRRDHAEFAATGMTGFNIKVAGR